MNVYVQGNANAIDLGTKEFLAQGGEGSVYAKSGVAYKIYTDSSKMISTDKIKELSVLKKKNILNPKNILLNTSNKPIGYTMDHISKTSALCQVFTKAFRDRNKINNDNIIDLVKNMQTTVDYIHSNNILIVDLNEMNFLVNDDFNEVYFIDVDSYQTKHFPATAIMESIRDRHCNGKWSKLTDWFSFGVVSFQLFIGIHPFKGKHPSLSGFDERMMANQSVFNKQVTIPKVCYPFNVIPQSYLDWYKAIFDQGKRVAPPTDLIPTIIITPIIKKITGTHNFDIKELLSLNENISDLFSFNGNTIISTTNNVYLNEKPLNIKTKGATFFGVTPKKNNFVLGYIENGHLKLYNCSERQNIEVNLSVDEISNYDGRIYVKTDTDLMEIEWIEINGKPLIPSFRKVANVHNNSKLFYGVAIQNLLGTYWATVFPSSKTSYTVKIDNIKGQILDAKFDNKVLIVTTSISNGKNIDYNKYIIRFDSSYKTYDIKVRTSNDNSDINFTTLSNGVVCSFNEEQNIVLFKNKKDDILFKVFEDKEIKDDIKLFKDGNNVLFTLEDTLYTLKMK